IPGMLSFLIHGNFHEPIPGLDQVKPEDQPPVAIPFVTYHVMVVLGMFFIGLTLLGLFLYRRGTLFEHRWLLVVFVVSVLGPYAASAAKCPTGRGCAPASRTTPRPLTPCSGPLCRGRPRLTRIQQARCRPGQCPAPSPSSWAGSERQVRSRRGARRGPRPA